MMVEEWRTIEGFDEYEVSNMGLVRSKDRFVNVSGNGKRLIKGQILKSHSCRHGYQYLSLCSKSKHTHFQVHRLVAQAFIPNPGNKPQVNHIDNNPRNNRVDNLEWVTAQENSTWKVICGRSGSKLKKPIIATNIATGEKTFYESASDAVQYGFDRAAIWRCLTGEYSKHHNHKFEYA